jgi:hypothetical protein
MAGTFRRPSALRPELSGGAKSGDGRNFPAAERPRPELSGGARVSWGRDFDCCILLCTHYTPSRCVCQGDIQNFFKFFSIGCYG